MGIVWVLSNVWAGRCGFVVVCGCTCPRCRTPFAGSRSPIAFVLVVASVVVAFAVAFSMLDLAIAAVVVVVGVVAVGVAVGVGVGAGVGVGVVMATVVVVVGVVVSVVAVVVVVAVAAVDSAGMVVVVDSQVWSLTRRVSRALSRPGPNTHACGFMLRAWGG